MTDVNDAKTPYSIVVARQKQQKSGFGFQDRLRSTV